MSQQFQVIARKWRPQSFEEVVGQQHVVRTLRNAIATKRIAHGYLFVGPRGTGKTTLARIFAKALNCTDGPKADFDPADPACVEIAEGRSMDVIEIDGASNNGVDNIRDLRDEVRYAPTRGQFKIYIIDEVHMLSAGAFNALLKTLEEPPPHVKFIFATTEVQKVLPTILSRVQRFDLKPIEDRLIIERLGFICAEEGIEAAPEALAAVARLADGGMRDAQSILDQMISFCGTKISAADVFDVYGLAPVETLRQLVGALASADHPVVLRIVDELDHAGRNLLRVLLDLQYLVRQALLDSIGKGGSTKALGPDLRTEQLTLLLDALRRGEDVVKFGVCERVDFEVTLLKAIEESRSRAIDSLIFELSKLAAESGDGTTDGSKKKRLMARLEAALASLKSAPVAASHGGPSAEIGAGLGRVPDGVRLPPAGSRPTRATPRPPPEDPGADETGEDVSFEAAEPVERKPAHEEHAAPTSEDVSAPSTSVDELSWEAAAPAEIEPEINMAAVLAKVPPQVLDQLEEWFRTKPTRVRRVDLTKLIK